MSKQRKSDLIFTIIFFIIIGICTYLIAIV